MFKSSKVFGALAVAGLVAVGGSAFAAASTIDPASTFVGAVSQSISGVAVTAVNYTVIGGDITTEVSFTVGAALAADPIDHVTAKITGLDAVPAAATETVTCIHTTTTLLTCTFVDGIHAVTGLDIVVS